MVTISSDASEIAACWRWPNACIERSRAALKIIGQSPDRRAALTVAAGNSSELAGGEDRLCVVFGGAGRLEPFDADSGCCGGGAGGGGGPEPRDRSSSECSRSESARRLSSSPGRMI